MRAAWLLLLCLTACPGPGGNVRPPDPVGGEASTSQAKPQVMKIACGDFHTCAVMSDRSVWCWGRNKSGELGDGTDIDRTTPVSVKGFSGAAEIALGANFSCAVSDGVWCWGSGRLMGDGKIVDKLPPTRVPVANAKLLRAGGYMICALGDSDVKCWGLDPNPPGAPKKDVVELAVAGAHGCARMKDATVTCWGEGIWGAPAGKESFASPGISKAKQIATGDGFGCALLENGSIACWGRNDEGELGTQPDADNHVQAANVPRISAAIQVAAAESHVCAITAGNTVTCWGANDEGELGRGTRTLGETPQSLVNLRAQQIAIGADHTCVLTPEGDVMCWGSNRNGQLGDGTTERRLVPTKVIF